MNSLDIVNSLYTSLEAAILMPLLLNSSASLTNFLFRSWTLGWLRNSSTFIHWHPSSSRSQRLIVKESGLSWTIMYMSELPNKVWWAWRNDITEWNSVSIPVSSLTSRIAPSTMSSAARIKSNLIFLVEKHYCSNLKGYFINFLCE